MSRELKIILLVILGLGVIIQFVPSKLPDNSQSSTYNFIVEDKVPSEIATLLKTACYDCHSQEVRYPWYSYVAPVKWQVATDVDMGRKHLDFSYWNQLDKKEKLNILSDIADEVSFGSMPMSIYTLLHKEARLTPVQRETIVSWTENFAEKVLEE